MWLKREFHTQNPGQKQAGTCWKCNSCQCCLSSNYQQSGKHFSSNLFVGNGCIFNDPSHLPQVKVGSVNFYSTGYMLDHYQSLRGTSKAEAIHSVPDWTGCLWPVRYWSWGVWCKVGLVAPWAQSSSSSYESSGKESTQRQHVTKAQAHPHVVIFITITVLHVWIFRIIILYLRNV